MVWLKIRKEDIQRGTVIRMTRMMDDGSYCMATIVGTKWRCNKSNDEFYPNVLVARPYVYAHENFDVKNPLMSVEVFEISVSKLLSDDSDVEVFLGLDNKPRSLVT